MDTRNRIPVPGQVWCIRVFIRFVRLSQIPPGLCLRESGTKSTPADDQSVPSNLAQCANDHLGEFKM
jgi:hypothetical protein